MRDGVDIESMREGKGGRDVENKSVCVGRSARVSGRESKWGGGGG